MDEPDINFIVTIGAMTSTDFHLGSESFDFGLALAASKTREALLQDVSESIESASMVIFSSDLSLQTYLLKDSDSVYDPRESESEYIVTILAGETLQFIFPAITTIIKGSSSPIGCFLTQYFNFPEGCVYTQYILSSSGWSQFGIYPFSRSDSGNILGVPQVSDSSDGPVNPKVLFEKFLEEYL